jgi:hypothetical protein
MAAELCAVAGHLPRAVLGARRPVLEAVAGPEPRPEVTVTTPVLLIHGYLGTTESWAPLVRALHGAGYANVFTFRYNSLAAGIPELATGLVDAATVAMEVSGRRSVHLVGHSLGGLVARYAVQRLGLAASARSVATIATPHQGTLCAAVAPGRAAAQMRPGHPMIAGLPALGDGDGVSWVVIYSDADRVVPPACARSGHPGSDVLLPGHGHLGILRSPRVRHAIVRHLRAAEEEPPAPGTRGAPPLVRPRPSGTRRIRRPRESSP